MRLSNKNASKFAISSCNLSCVGDSASFNGYTCVTRQYRRPEAERTVLIFTRLQLCTFCLLFDCYYRIRNDFFFFFFVVLTREQKHWVIRGGWITCRMLRKMFNYNWSRLLAEWAMMLVDGRKIWKNNCWICRNIVSIVWITEINKGS